MTSCIIVTSAGTACPVAPAPDTPKVERRIADLWNRQDAISLAKSATVLRALASNPVPKGKTYE